MIRNDETIENKETDLPVHVGRSEKTGFHYFYIVGSLIVGDI